MKFIQSFINNRIVNMIIAIILFLVVSSMIITYLTIDSKNYDIERLTDGWKVLVSGKVYEDVSIEKDEKYRVNINKGDRCILTRKIASDKKIKDINSPIIAIETQSCPIDIYVDNKKIGSNYTDIKSNIKGNFYARLPKDYKNKTLKIECLVRDEDVINIIDEIFIISEDNYFMFQLRDNMLKHVAGTFMIVLGVILLTVALVIPNKNFEFKRLVWIGVICLFGGMGLYARFELLDLYINNIYVTENITYICLFVCIICILLMARNTYTNKRLKKLITYYIVCSSIFYVTLIILHNINVLKYSSVSTGVGVSIIITALILLYFNKSNYRQINSIEKIFTVGTSICYVETLIMLLIAAINKTIDWDAYGKYELVLLFITFFFVVMVYYIYVLNYYMEKITEKNILYHVAYTDYLTNLHNRVRYEEVINAMKEESLQGTIIISFDLNNLKNINDSIGHDAGDIYIKTFATSLKNILGDYGFVGRIGGDEFCSIIKDKSIDIKKKIEQLQNMFVEELKEEKWKDEVSFAYGYAYGDELKEKDIEELINLADKRMYENKAASKRKKKISRKNS